MTVLQKKVKAIILSLVCVTFSFSQDNSFKRNPYIYSKNTFSFHLSNGFNKTKYEALLGDKNIKSGIGHVPKLDLDYTFSLTEHFGISLGAGIGFFPFIHKVDPQNGFKGTEGWRYIDLVNYNPFSRLTINVKYQKWVAPKYAIKALCGIGTYKFTPLGMEISSVSPTGIDYLINAEYSGNFSYNFSTAFGVDRLLKNDDLIGLSITYDFMPQSIVTGSYYLENNTKNGSLKNNGSHLSLSLNYTFTRARKMLRSEEIVLSEDIDFKDAKKNVRKEKRYIDPKSVFLNVSGGFFGAKNKVDNDFAYLETSSIPSWVFSGNVEVGHEKNRFWQLGFSTSEYFSAHKLNIPNYPSFGSSGHNIFLASQITAGYGLRLIGKNNINYLNISGGIGLSYNYKKKQHSLFWSKELTANGAGDTLFLLETFGRGKSKWFPTLYLNFGRDFQLTKSVYLSFDYRLNIGVISTYEEEVFYSEKPDLTLQEKGNLKVTGSSYAFQVGLKYKFVPKSNY